MRFLLTEGANRAIAQIVLKEDLGALDMPEFIYAPYRSELYSDLIRLSDGRIDPADEAETRLLVWLEAGPLSDPDWFYERFGERVYEFAEKYSPYLLEALERESREPMVKREPLVWKEITVPSGSDVRMFYAGQYHYAKVAGGKIADETGEFSPSEWVYKVANYTSRNAWRDIWFKEPGATAWAPAQLLREQAREARRTRGAAAAADAEGN